MYDRKAGSASNAGAQGEGRQNPLAKAGEIILQRAGLGPFFAGAERHAEASVPSVCPPRAQSSIRGRFQRKWAANTRMSTTTPKPTSIASSALSMRISNMSASAPAAEARA